MKTKKILALALCAVLLVGASVMGTLAYLKAETDTVHNTFTVGKVAFDQSLNGGLDEVQVDPYGVPSVKTETKDEEGKTVVTWTPSSEAPRVKANTYKLIPGHEYTKDPTIHMAADTEDAFLFVKVVDGLAAIEAEGKTTADQMKALGWAPVEGAANIWCLADENGPVKVTASESKVIFSKLNIDAKADIKGYEAAVIEVSAYAVQADGFGGKTPAYIWTEAFAGNNEGNNSTQGNEGNAAGDSGSQEDPAEETN